MLEVDRRVVALARTQLQAVRRAICADRLPPNPLHSALADSPERQVPGPLTLRTLRLHETTSCARGKSPQFPVADPPRPC
jgi:hypothetical protein